LSRSDQIILIKALYYSYLQSLKVNMETQKVSCYIESFVFVCNTCKWGIFTEYSYSYFNYGNTL